MEGELTKVGGDGVVTSGREEYIAVIRGVPVISSGAGGRAVVVMEGDVDGEEREN